MPREKIMLKIAKREQLLSGTMGSEELDAYVKRRLEEKIR